MKLERVYRKMAKAKATDNREKIARFVEAIVADAAQSPEDIPGVYRDLFLNVLLVLPPDHLMRVIEQMAKEYKQAHPKVKFPEDKWNKAEEWSMSSGGVNDWGEKFQ